MGWIPPKGPASRPGEPPSEKALAWLRQREAPYRRRSSSSNFPWPWWLVPLLCLLSLLVREL